MSNQSKEAKTVVQQASVQPERKVTVVPMNRRVLNQVQLANARRRADHQFASDIGGCAANYRY